MMIKIANLREIIHLIDDSSIHEFTYEANGEKIKLKKANHSKPTAKKWNESAEVISSVESDERKESTEELKTNAQDGHNSEKDSVEFDHEIISPMVGTIYHAPSPESDPYVSIGSTIAKDS